MSSLFNNDNNQHCDLIQSIRSQRRESPPPKPTASQTSVIPQLNQTPSPSHSIDSNEEFKSFNFVDNDTTEYDLGFGPLPIHERISTKNTNTFDSILNFLNNVPIKVASNTKAISIAIKELLSHNPSYVGFDCEWRPQFQKGKKQNKISLIQIAHHHIIILIRVHKLDNVYESLLKSGALKVLENKNIIKCGVGIRDDIIKMFHHHSVKMKKCIELNDINIFPNKPQIFVSLQKLCKTYLGYDMKYKSKAVSTSNWEYRTLSNKQIFYAAEDSWVPLKILEQGVQLNQNLVENIDVYTNKNVHDECMEQCRDAMRYIAQHYCYFKLNDFCRIYFELMRWEMPRRYKKRVREIVWYFDDIFNFDVSTQEVFSKIYTVNNNNHCDLVQTIPSQRRESPPPKPKDNSSETSQLNETLSTSSHSIESNAIKHNDNEELISFNFADNDTTEYDLGFGYTNKKHEYI